MNLTSALTKLRAVLHGPSKPLHPFDEELLHGGRADREFIRQFLDVARSKDGKPPPPKLVSQD